MRRFLFILLLPVMAFTFPSPGKMAPDDKKCIDCHTAIMTGKTTHKPVKENCDVCHKSNGSQHPLADTKGFTLVKDLPDLCYNCHAPLNTKKKIHAPVNNGKCLLCHSVHSSDNANLLKETPVGKTCLECHDDLGLDENKSQHSPVIGGKCSDCHDPHQSDAEKLLKLEGQELCFKCHTQAKADLKQKSVHPPFANKCVVCHKPHGSKEEHLLTTKLPDLCWGCHDELQADVDKAPFKHNALNEGKTCINCHSPHSSPNDSLVKTAPIGKICESCHNLGMAAKKVKHAPALAGNCVECHDPHKSDIKKLVKAPTPELCGKCHEKPKAALAQQFVHPPFKNNCIVCHNPHASDEDHLVSKNIKELCVGCHDDFEEPLGKPGVHQALNDKKSCTNCHSPHASGTEKILLTDQKSLCLGCHNKSYKKGDRVMTNMKQLLQKSKYQHGAIAKDGCTGCHNPHFSDNSKLLVGKFPGGIYVNAVKDTFSLCFKCHDSQLMTMSQSNTVTKFRNGEKNLHYLHVNGKKGRNCSVCHEIHASDNDHLIVDKFQFGDWSMKMNYMGQPNGGSCTPGCHGEKSYLR